MVREDFTVSLHNVATNKRLLDVNDIHSFDSPFGMTMLVGDVVGADLCVVLNAAGKHGCFFFRELDMERCSSMEDLFALKLLNEEQMTDYELVINLMNDHHVSGMVRMEIYRK